jgi:hypothetical protein
MNSDFTIAVLPQIFAYLSNTEIMYTIMTCKKLYSVCKSEGKYWHRTCIYEDVFMRSVGAKNIQKVTINEDHDLCEVLDCIRRLDNIRKILYNNPCVDTPFVTNCITKLNNNVIILELDVITIKFIIIEKILKSDTLESFILRYSYLNNEEDEDEHYINKVGRNYKRITLETGGDLCRTDLIYNPEVKGLQILESEWRTKFNENIIMEHAKTLISFNVSATIGICPEMANLVELVCGLGEYRHTSENIIKELTSLKDLYAIHLSEIKPDTFDKLINLVNLDLYYESSVIVNINFAPLKNLKYLNLHCSTIPFDKLLCLRNLKELIYNEGSIDRNIDTDIDFNNWEYIIKMIDANNIMDIKRRYKLSENFTENTFPLMKRFIYKRMIWLKAKSEEQV